MAKKEFKKTPVPAYMTSFADMMTIVLTFFILLYSYSTEQINAIIRERAEAFKVSIENFGLPGLVQKRKKPVDLDNQIPKYPVFPGIKNEKEQPLRDLESHLATLTGVQVDKFSRDPSPRISLVPFVAKQHSLTPGQKERLRPILPILAKKKGTISVIGHASGELSSSGANLSLAHKRAMAVVMFLQSEGRIPYWRLRPIARIGSSQGNVELSFEQF